MQLRAAFAASLLWLLCRGTSPVSATPSSDFLAEGEAVVAIPGAADGLRLADCVSAALEGNEALRQEREGLSEVRAQLMQARATALPRLDLQSGWSRGRDPSFALDAFFSDNPGLPLFGPGDIPPQSFWRSSLDASWEIRPTRVLSALRSAHRAFDRQFHSVRGREHEVVANALQAYHRVILAHERRTAVQAELDARAQFLEISRRRFVLELDAPLDTLQAAVSLANLKPDLRRASLNLHDAGVDLNLAMGRDALDPLTVVATFEVESEEISLPRALKSAATRPDVRHGEGQTAFLRGRRDVERAINHPFLTLEGSYGYVGRTTDTLFDEGHDLWRAAVTLKVPIWDGMTARGVVRELEATIRRAEYAESELMHRARAEISMAHEELAISRANLVAAELNLTMASDVYDQMQLRYELGKADFLDVLSAQSERFTARSNWVQARYDVFVGSSALKRAMGVSPATSFAEILATTESQEASR
ncbi:MAG TPA: TolC family protein [Candidatus Krumholzibacteria bacterium]|jgi:outer membrane protein TolC